MKKLWLVLSISLFSCQKKAVIPANIDTAGLWGGQGVQLNVTENSADFEFDCAFANIKSKLKTADNEVVEQFGTYTYEHGGPIKIDEKPDVHPARFAGTIEKDSMKLSITILDQKRPDISLKMKRNTKGLVYKCL